MALFQKKQETSVKCQSCFDARYEVDLKINGFLSLSLCPDCIPSLNYSNEVILQAKGKCKYINEMNLDPDNIDSFNSFMKDISKSNENKNIFRALSLFMERYPKIKKENKHIEMLKKPEENRFVRPVEPHQFTAIHLFTRNQVFQIVSKENRKKYSKISEIDNSIIDIPLYREFLGLGGDTKFAITGPLLCDYDQSVFDACIKIWNEKKKSGIILETNLTKIWHSMGNKSKFSIKNKESLKRSLDRLISVSLKVTSTNKKNKNFWVGGLIDNVLYIDGNNQKNNKVIIYFNLYMAANYLNGYYATLSHSVYLILSIYARKIYVYLMSHDHWEREIGLDKLRILMGVTEDISEKHFKEQLNFSLKELIDNKILDKSSKIEYNKFHSRILKEAWVVRPNYIETQLY